MILINEVKMKLFQTERGTIKVALINNKDHDEDTISVSYRISDNNIVSQFFDVKRDEVEEAYDTMTEEVALELVMDSGVEIFNSFVDISEEGEEDYDSNY